MFNSVFIVLTTIVSVFGLTTAIYYAFSTRRNSIKSYVERNHFQDNACDPKNQNNAIETGPIKLFVYLDEDKMYSLSSQFFEGITNGIMMGDVSTHGQTESQLGDVMSGNFMASMMLQKNTTSVSRSLNDFAFTLFEKELVRRNMLYTIKAEDTPDSLKDKCFVKVIGKVSIYDYSKTLKTVEKFNDLGKAIGYLQRNTDLSEADLKSQGLAIDKKMQEHVKLLIQFGYNNRLEVIFTINGSNQIYSTTVNRAFLKDPEDIIISRYSQMPEKDFSLIGIVSQVGKVQSSSVGMESRDMKMTMRSITDKVAGLDNAFFGRVSNECIIDPIAIFTEIG